MDEQQIQQQIIQLVQAAMSGDQQATQYIQQVMQAAQQGDQQAAQLAQMIQAVAQQLQGQQVQAAKFGAKLNYIRQLRGTCPEGYEMQYFKNGGKPCKRCVAKQKMEEGGEAPSNPVDAFKCGRKMKVEKASGGSRFKQTTKTDKDGNVTHTRTYPGNKPVSYITGGEGEGYYSDHRGRAKVEDQDSLANVYHNGPRKPNFKKKNNKVSKHKSGKKFGYVKQYDGDSEGSSEVLRANEGYENNPNIGNRTIYRIIQGNDTIIPVYSSGQFNGSAPIVIYDKTSPNFQKLNALFDSEKSKRVLDNYGTYFDEVKQVYRIK